MVDPTYIEDFLLTYRTFMSSPLTVGQRLLDWFSDPILRDKVWINKRRIRFCVGPSVLSNAHMPSCSLVGDTGRVAVGQQSLQ